MWAAHAYWFFYQENPIFFSWAEELTFGSGFTWTYPTLTGSKHRYRDYQFRLIDGDLTCLLDL